MTKEEWEIELRKHLILGSNGVPGLALGVVSGLLAEKDAEIESLEHELEDTRVLLELAHDNHTVELDKLN